MHLTEQEPNHTRYDRYPAIFAAAKAASGPEPLRILSFGCSTGEEPRTLAEKYFPSSRILGVDVAPEVLAAARARTQDLANVSIAASDAASVAASGLYDLVFAMSVLCRNPAPKDWSEYPFARFEARVAELTALLKPGGVLALANTNYRLTQSRLIRFYDLIVEPEARDPGQVWRLAPDGSVLEMPNSGPVATDCLFRKRMSPRPDSPDIPLAIARPDGAALVTLWLRFP
jgi:SAM-dependent methyltransferase